ncbi:MAG: glycosyltransferase family 2 protein [Lachnospiraceae bacterium]|nr:glycosyltransferase family 2 protein [Lachnospiraceae bacterium]
MLSGKLVSVIVPVYNAERTLERCIKSILNQTYRNLEIIMVDDASTDSSREVMLSLEQSDPERIMVVFSDENRGAGGARNIALEYAHGDYLSFVDSDDYIHSSFIGSLVTELETGGYDFADCGYFDERNDKAILHTGRNLSGVLSDESRSELIVTGGYLWSKLFRKELFFDNGIRFRENCILEDSEVLIELISRARSVGAVEDTLYWYSASPASISHVQPSVSYVNNIYEAMKAILSLRDKLDNYDSLLPAIEYAIIQMYDYGVLKVLDDMKTVRSLDTLNELNRLRDLRLTGVTEGYDNRYIQDKIQKTDLDILTLNDNDPVSLINRIG